VWSCVVLVLVGSCVVLFLLCVCMCDLFLFLQTRPAPQVFFKARVYPWAKCGDLEAEDWANVHAAAAETIGASYLAQSALDALKTAVRDEESHAVIVDILRIQNDDDEMLSPPEHPLPPSGSRHAAVEPPPVRRRSPAVSSAEEPPPVSTTGRSSPAVSSAEEPAVLSEETRGSMEPDDRRTGAVAPARSGGGVARTRGTFAAIAASFQLLVYRKGETAEGWVVQRAPGPHGRSVFWVEEVQVRGRPSPGEGVVE